MIHAILASAGSRPNLSVRFPAWASPGGPARAAYPHSASVYSRFAAPPARPFSRPMNPCTSSQETCSTGQLPQPEKREGFDPITACHSDYVTSRLPCQKPRLIRTRVTGCSQSKASELVEPIKNSPGGT